MSGLPLRRRRGPPLTTPVSAASASAVARRRPVSLVRIRDPPAARGRAATRRASPVPERTEPSRRDRPAAALAQLDHRSVEGSRTASAPAPGSVVVPKIGSELDQLARVRAGEVVLGPLGRPVPALAAAARIRPGLRLRPSTSRAAPSEDLDRVLVRERRHVGARAGALGQQRGSCGRRPPRSPARRRGPRCRRGLRGAVRGPITK